MFFESKHINMNRDMHNKIARRLLKHSLLIVEIIKEKTREHPNKNIGSESYNALTVNET